MFDSNRPSDSTDLPGPAQGIMSAKAFEALTDALRAGPGTPAWTAAAAMANANDLEFLFKARQRLESGKQFRSLESSPLFKQAVLASVAMEARAPLPLSRHRSLSSRTVSLVGALAAIVVFVIAGIVIEFMMTNGTFSGNPDIRLPVRPAPEAGVHSFERFLPVGWQTMGSLRVKADHGLRLAGGLKQLDQSGGVYWPEPLPRSRPFNLLAKVHYTGSASIAPEIFITDEETFDDDRPADRNHEFVWTIAGDKPTVRLANQTVAFAGAPVRSGVAAVFLVDMKINGATASVAIDDAGVCTHWTGMHLLAGDKPWRMGVRFVVHATNHDDCVAVDAIRVH